MPKDRVQRQRPKREKHIKQLPRMKLNLRSLVNDHDSGSKVRILDPDRGFLGPFKGNVN